MQSAAARALQESQHHFCSCSPKLHLLRHQYSDEVGPHVMRCEDRAGVDPGRASSPSSTSQARRSPSTTRQLPYERAHTHAVGCSLGFVAPRCAGGRVCGLRPDLGRRRCHGVIDTRAMCLEVRSAAPLPLYGQTGRACLGPLVWWLWVVEAGRMPHVTCT